MQETKLVAIYTSGTGSTISLLFMENKWKLKQSHKIPEYQTKDKQNKQKLI